MSDETIYRNPVHADERLDAMPEKFGNKTIMIEFAIYDSLKSICAHYSGGFWMFYRLSNGGFYMAPDDENWYEIVCPGNGYTGTLSADAAGITACLYAYSSVSMAYGDDNVIDAYHQLLAWAKTHPEADKIFAAID